MASSVAASMFVHEVARDSEDDTVLRPDGSAVASKFVCEAVRDSEDDAMPGPDGTAVASKGHAELLRLVQRVIDDYTKVRPGDLLPAGYTSIKDVTVNLQPTSKPLSPLPLPPFTLHRQPIVFPQS